MKKKFLLISCTLLLGLFSTANASFIVEQYDNYWSTSLSNLEAYALNNTASTIAEWDIIDFTDDPGGFAGDIPGSNPWPSAAAAGATGTGHILNTTFFARITGDFYVGADDTFTFRTFSDDGVFLYVDDDLIINDPSLHAEQIRTGDKTLSNGMHSVELYFFENTGEASLEFTLKGSNGDYTHFDDDDYQTPGQAPVPEPAAMLLFGIGLVGLAGVQRRKQ